MFHLDKRYLDVITDQGTVVIVYVARMDRWFSRLAAAD